MVYAAREIASMNRFELVKAVAMAARKLTDSSTTVSSAISAVLARIARGERIVVRES